MPREIGYTVASDIAKKWIKAPANFKRGLRPMVDSKDLIFTGRAVVSRMDGGAIKKLCDHMKGKKDKRAIVVANTLDEEGESIGYGRCQISGNFMSLDKLRYRRIYNIKVFCMKPSGDSMRWLMDTQQWVFKRDSRIPFIKFYGDKQYFVSSASYITDNITNFVQSTIESAYVYLPEATAVYNSVDNTDQAVLVSNYEIRNQNFNRYHRCNSCSRVVTPSLMREGSRRCNSCHEARVSSTPANLSLPISSPRSRTMPENIYNYSHRVEGDLGMDETGCIRIGSITTGSEGKIGEPVMLGIELEYNIPENKRTDSAGDINKSKYAQCKADGTVQGYEIVSKPCSIDVHRTNITKIMAKHGAIFDPASNCGLHVHISRRPFTNSEIGKVLGFVHREHNREFITGMARRDSHRYARFSDSYIKEHKRNPVAMNTTASYAENSGGAYMNGQKVMKYDTHLQTKVRYTALNIKDNTLEFRIFAATKEVHEIMACLEFCEAIFMYAHEHSGGSVSHLSLAQWLKIENFISFVEGYKIKLTAGSDRKPATFGHRYPELIEYFSKRKLVKTSKDTEEVWESKLTRAFIDKVIPVEKHRVVPKRIQKLLINELRKSPFNMTKWLSSTGDNFVRFDFSDKYEHGVWNLFISNKLVYSIPERAKEELVIAA